MTISSNYFKGISKNPYSSSEERKRDALRV